MNRSMVRGWNSVLAAVAGSDNEWFEWRALEQFSNTRNHDSFSDICILVQVLGPYKEPQESEISAALFVSLAAIIHRQSTINN